MLNIAVLGSTSGTDLQGIIDAINNNKLQNINIKCVISNKKDAYILTRAKLNNLNPIFVDPVGKKRVTYDKQITKILEELDIELVLLIGYMKLMSPEFVKRWENKVMNIHPSLLPAFAGGMDLNVHQAVLERGCKITGASLIFIDDGPDTGPIISQDIVLIDQYDTSDTLKKKVQNLEVKLLLEAIELFRDNLIDVQDKKVYILENIISTS